MAGAGQKRITKVRLTPSVCDCSNRIQELGELTTSPPTGVTVELKDDNNLHSWKVIMDGPSGTPYMVRHLVVVRNIALMRLTPIFKGGKFDLELTLPPNYPFKPPTVTFKTKLYHPNVSNDTPPNSGLMCLGMLRDSEWKPSTKMSAVLEYIRHLLRGKFKPSCMAVSRIESMAC